MAVAVSSGATGCAFATTGSSLPRTAPNVLEVGADVSDRPAREAPSLDAEPLSLVGTAKVGRIRAFHWPGAPRPFDVFRDPNEYGYRVVFLVKRMRDQWMEVYLPIRPNGATGWIRARDVGLSENPFRIDVDLSSNRLMLRRGERVVMRERVGVGTRATPTPTGLFYTRMEARTGDPRGVYGPYIQVLSAYSEVHRTFGGGNGEVGIHGTNDASGLGHDVSNGCIRMRNAAITRLTRIVPVGTPVRIRD